MQNNVLIKQFVKFGIVGTSNTLVHLSVYYLCIYIFFFHYQISNLFGFLVSVTNAYYWYNWHIFKPAKHCTIYEYIKTYCKTLLACNFIYLLSIGLLWFWVEVADISEGIAPLLNTVITLPINFYIQKNVTFKRYGASQ